MSSYSKVEEYPARGTYESDHIARRDSRDALDRVFTIDVKKHILLPTGESRHSTNVMKKVVCRPGSGKRT